MTYANFFYKKKIPAVLGGARDASYWVLGIGRPAGYWTLRYWVLDMGYWLLDMGDGRWVIFLQIIFVLFAYVKDLY